MDIKCFSVGLLRTNCYIVYNGNNAVIFDPGCRSKREIDEIEIFIEEKSLNVLAVILTHCHFDHILGVDIFAEHYHCPVYISDADANGFYDCDRNLSLSVRYEFIPKTGVLTFSDVSEILIADMRFTAYITPGHTPGSSCFVIDDIIFTGDTVFYLSVGRTDLLGGDQSALQRSLIRIRDICKDKDYRFLCGHGPETTAQFEFKNNDNFMRG